MISEITRVLSNESKKSSFGLWAGGHGRGCSLLHIVVIHLGSSSALTSATARDRA